MNCNKTSRRKAATFIIEQVLLFMIGIMIVGASIMLFSNYNEYFNEVSARSHAEDIAGIITSSILKLSEKKSDSRILMSFCKPPAKGCLPDRIGGEDYMILLSQNNVTVKTLDSETGTVASLLGINESFMLSGRVYSSSGSFLIFKQGDEIILR